MAKTWLIDVLGNFADAALLVSDMNGVNVGLGLAVTRLLIYAVQVVSAILLGGRPRPKSANLSEPCAFAGLFVYK